MKLDQLNHSVKDVGYIKKIHTEKLAVLCYVVDCYVCGWSFDTKLSNVKQNKKHDDIDPTNLKAAFVKRAQRFQDYNIKNA